MREGLKRERRNKLLGRNLGRKLHSPVRKGSAIFNIEQRET